jgi:signal transduction histidine kinase
MRRPVRWLRDLPIWTKLGLIMIVPTLATIVIGTAGLLDHVAAANGADRARTLAVLSGDAGHLVHELQDERASAIMLLGAPANQAEVLLPAYRKQQGETDEAQKDYRFRRNTLADLPTNLRALLTRIDGQLSSLPDLRTQVTDPKKIPLSQAENSYSVLILDLLAIRDLSAQLTGDTTLTDRMRAAAFVGTAKEYLSQERVTVLQALASGDFPQSVHGDYLGKRKAQDLALQQFRTVATPEQIELLERSITGPDVRDSRKFEGSLDSLPGERIPPGLVPADRWDATMVARSGLMNQVEITLNEQAQEAAVRLGNEVQRQVLVETGLLLVTLLLGVLFAWLVARSMARSLRDLRQGALAVAQYGLPQAVARLRDPALSTQLSPAGVALQIAEPLPVRSKDEFGQVTEAFNAVHLEAVRTAAEQAALRASVATMFVNLARRSQILVDRLIGHLDRLERGEQDPDRLSELFQLDHLATRMRRNDENLLVLAGADSTRIQREPAALMDVLRAAQSEVEHYTRLEFGVIDHDIEIAAHAVNDLVHLVAELFDNATAFSPPDSSITVEARRVGDRAVLQVEDRGIGMSPDQYSELNERLAKPPLVDVAVSRMMGLVVVSRLAARHGVKVELRPAQERGTVADVLLPSGVLVPRALAGRTKTPTGFPATRPPAMPPHRVFPPPLALESGPTLAPAASAWPPADPRTSGDQPWPTEGPTWGSGGDEHYPPTVPAPALPTMPPLVPPSGLPFGGNPYANPREPAGAPTSGAGPTSGPPFVGPTSGPPAGGLGAALAGDLAGAGPNGANGAGRALPAWYDLTGAGDGPDSGGAPSAPSGGDPLPQRRPANQWGGTPEPDSGPPIPRQMPNIPEARAGDPAAATGPYGTYPPGVAPAAPALPTYPPSSYPPPAPARPPVWPPVSADPDSSPDAVPPVPERLAASLDMTSELPKVRLDFGSTDADTASPSGDQSPSRYADDLTMELPIFRELESAWFRVAHTAPPDTTLPEDAPAPARAGGKGRGRRGPSDEGAGDGTVTASTAGTASWTDASAGSPGALGRPAEVSWRTVADDGWTAAEAAAEPQDGGTTETGLPRRVPMAQLVPGGVDNATAGSERRTPEAVRGLLSAYHRGVQRGRRAGGNSPEPTTTGSQPTQGGKEQEA